MKQGYIQLALRLLLITNETVNLDALNLAGMETNVSANFVC